MKTSPKRLHHAASLASLPRYAWFFILICYAIPPITEFLTADQLFLEVRTAPVWFLSFVPPLFFVHYSTIRMSLISVLFSVAVHIAVEIWDQPARFTLVELGLALEVACTNFILIASIGYVLGKLKLEKSRLMTANKELAKRKEQLANIFDNLDVTIWSLDLETGELELSASCSELFGKTKEELLLCPQNYWKSSILPEDRELADALERTLISGEPGSAVYRILHTDGTIRWIQDRGVPFRNAKGQITRIDGVMIDVTENQLLLDKARKLATTDPLTGLLNRRGFEENLARILSLADREKSPFAVLFLDLDGFKTVNDSLGHDAGDLLLREVAEEVAGCVREGDIVSRLAGDEFALLLPGAAGPEATQIAERISARMQRLHTIGDRPVTVTSSIGVALYPEHGEDGPSLVKNADIAMYLAKLQGKNRYHLFRQPQDETMLH